MHKLLGPVRRSKGEEKCERGNVSMGKKGGETRGEEKDIDFVAKITAN